MNEKIQNILTEIESVIVGKNENVEKILMAILAQGHVLMEDVPGVGKTTTALDFRQSPRPRHPPRPVHVGHCPFGRHRLFRVR